MLSLDEKRGGRRHQGAMGDVTRCGSETLGDDEDDDEVDDDDDGGDDDDEDDNDGRVVRRIRMVQQTDGSCVR
ncbi:MAG: hypothetical protein M1837_005935 [Sclerophora amabilis]|nr:MAG: hypothetical protein M1837_005935 [Sclerophora amabilis]